MAAVLQRLIEPEATATRHPFVDVSAGGQQVPVAWMAETETTTGTSATTFGPDDLALLRHVNGGESGPLSGQRVCAP